MQDMPVSKFSGPLEYEEIMVVADKGFKKVTNFHLSTAWGRRLPCWGVYQSETFRA